MQGLSFDNPFIRKPQKLKGHNEFLGKTNTFKAKKDASSTRV